MNQATLVGNLGGDVEIRYTQQQFPIGHLRLATTEHWRDKEGAKKSKTTWHHVKIYGKRAEALKPFLLKGRQVMVQGQIDVEEYEDREGTKRQFYTIAVRDGGVIELLGRPPKDAAGNENATNESREGEQAAA